MNQYLQNLHHERERWQQLVQGLSDEQLSQRVLPGGLAIKDVLAHLAAWMVFECSKLEARIEKKEPQTPPWFDGLNPHNDQQIINALIFDAYKDHLLADIVREWSEQYQRVINLGEEISEEEYREIRENPSLMGEAVYETIYGTYTHHHEEHYQPLTEWLTNQGWNR